MFHFQVVLFPFFLHLKFIVCWLQTQRDLEELKQSAEEKAAAVKSAEDGAADLKKRYEELSKNLDEHEKEYQVSLLMQNIM